MKKSVFVVLCAFVLLFIMLFSVYTIKVDASSLDSMVYEFKAKRVDAPFIKGYDNGTTFKPDGNMTRAEACIIITRLLTAEEGIKGKYISKFADVKAGSWYYDAIAYLESKGYLDSYSGTFMPDQKITRAEFVELVYKMGKIADGDKKVSFTDVPATHPRYDVIMAAAKSGLVNGKTATTFDPDGDIKRSEVVKVICMALGRTPTKKGIIKVDGFKDVPESHWAYPYVIEASYRHSLTVQSNGEEKWNEIVENQLVIYPEYPEQIDRNYDFEVTVTQGDKSAKIPVYDETRQPSSTRSPYGDNYRRFCEFAFSGEPVRIDIKCNMSFSEYTLIPAIKNIPSTVNGNVISVYVNEPMQLILRLGDGIDSNNRMLAVFVDPPEENVPDKNSPNVIWVDGWYEAENKEVRLTSGQTLYIAPGAVCNSRVYTDGGNVTICGRGMIRDPYDTRTPNIQGYNANVMLTNGRNIKIDGIKIVDCRYYHIYSLNTHEIEINNVKLISNQISTDGYCLSGSNIYIHNSFADVGDDVFTIDAANRLYEDLVVGSTCGIFSFTKNRSNETYRNISIFRADEAIFKNYYGSGGFSGAVFENIIAVDCPFSPHFFASSDQGTLPKNFVFKNVSINSLTGTDSKTTSFRSYKNQLINIKNGDLFTFDFENLYIDGKLITDASEFEVIDNSASKAKINITSNNHAAVIPLTPNKTVLETPFVYSEKPVVPLMPDENIVPNPSFEDGAVEWITVNFTRHELSDEAQDGKLSFYIPADKGEIGGVETIVTDGVNRGGKGNYLLEFYAKKSPDSETDDIAVAFVYYYGEVSRNTPMKNAVKVENFKLTNDWQKYTLTINIISDKVNSTMLKFRNFESGNKVRFYLDNVSLVKIGE